MTTPSLPPKKDVMLALLERSSVFIHLDPRHAEVRVPPWFKKQPQLVLQVGLNMAVRIPDLDVGDAAVSCTLSFNRSPFFCFVPWTAVFGLVGDDGKGMLWPTDIPPEVAAQQADRAQKEKARERLHSVGASTPAPATPVAPGPAEAAAKRGKAGNGRGRGGKSERAAAGGVAAKSAGSAGKREAPSRLRAEKTRPREVERPESAAGAPPERESKRALPPYLRVVK